jgi:Skp family chaperone for outer membrane proteins
MRVQCYQPERQQKNTLIFVRQKLRFRFTTYYFSSYIPSLLFYSMQKSTFSVLSICCLMSLAAAGSALYSWHSRSAFRIAYVNTDKLLGSYRAMVTARHQYQNEKREWEHNLRTLSEEAHQAAIQAQQAANTTRPAERLIHLREANLKQQQFLNYRQAVLKQEPEEMQRLTQPVIASVNRYIAAYSREHQYSLVLTTAGQGDVVYSDTKMDITTDVIQQINQYLADSLAQPTGARNGKPLAGNP